MEGAVQDCPISRILHIKDVVGEILVKVGSSRSLIRFSAVSRACLAAKKYPGLVSRFAEVNKVAFVGFLVEFKQLQEENTRLFRLIYKEGPSDEETTVALRRSIKIDLLKKDTILASSGGCVLTAGLGREIDPAYLYTSYPSDQPKEYKQVARMLPKIPLDGGQHTKNTYGQFGLMRKEGASGISFFVKDWGDHFFLPYEGAVLKPKEKIYIHVCELVDGDWVRHVSAPISPVRGDLFHRNAYTVLHGESLFLMYLVRYVYRLDLVSKKFSKIQLPDVVSQKVQSWFDYTICHHTKGGLAMIHYWGGMLYTWVLNSVNEGGSWKLAATTNLIEMCGPKIPVAVLSSMLSGQEDHVGRCNYYSVQVRSASSDGRFVLITLGFDPNLFMVDMDKKKVHEIGQLEGDGNIGRVYALTEHWPPKN